MNVGRMTRVAMRERRERGCMLKGFVWGNCGFLVISLEDVGFFTANLARTSSPSGGKGKDLYGVDKEYIIPN